MAVNFVARKCACGGKLEFDAAKKIWICKYCGTVVEREATFDRIQVDGIEGICDVVRQTLMDIANNRMESAAENLEDCERKNHSHVGTLIANISYYLAKITSAETQNAARASLDKVKLYAQRLSEDFPVIAEDEINLYEAFGDGAADIFANLFVVFDTLNDTGRVEYIASKLKPEEIFSEYANRNLLKVSIKRRDYAIVEAVARNVNHIDKTYCLKEIMLHYPGQGRKLELIDLLFDVSGAESLTSGFFETYFKESEDAIATKTSIIKKLAATNLRCSVAAIAKALYGQMDGYESAKNVFLALYAVKVSDQETEALLAFCLTENTSYEITTAFFDALSEQKVFVQLQAGAVTSFLDASQLAVDQKIEVLRRMFAFEIEDKALDAVYHSYLNRNADAVSERRQMIDFLLKEDSPISSNTARSYIIGTTTDGDAKPGIVEKIFATGIPKTYLGDLLSDYLIGSQDEKPVKDRIFFYLIDEGFKADSDALTQYISSPDIAAEDRMDKAKRMISSGTPVRADCLEQYLLSVAQPTEFSGELFDLLAGYHFTVGFAAYARFLLFCRDADRAKHNTILMQSFTGDVSTWQTTVNHIGNTVVCNLMQAYTLVSEDGYEIAGSVVSEFDKAKTKLYTDITVNGVRMKFKKYIAENKERISPLTSQICQENKSFFLF